MLTEVLGLIVALAVGVGLGFVYFGGLWVTVRHLPKTRRLTLLTLGSFFGRTALTLIGFAVVSGGRWERLIACLAGFILMRTFLLRRWRPTGAHAVRPGVSDPS